MNEHYVPTVRLRFVERRGYWLAHGGFVHVADVDASVVRCLQQWWAEPMPGYMRDVAKGEWRDVALEAE